MRGEALKGHLDLLLLAVLHRNPAHGYAVIEELRRLSGETFDLPEGTVYPALHRLERNGMIASRWSEESGRKRRIYELTPQGRKALEVYCDEWHRFADGVNSLLREVNVPCVA
ncbi:MAG: helix-turn-helix transcriptional regulator [Armatimonadetes bacterium]|nr:helix-turn-helix transcriptional regulator [Armatimonadota bacterium]